MSNFKNTAQRELTAVIVAALELAKKEASDYAMLILDEIENPKDFAAARDRITSTFAKSLGEFLEDVAHKRETQTKLAAVVKKLLR